MASYLETKYKCIICSKDEPCILIVVSELHAGAMDTPKVCPYMGHIAKKADFKPVK